MTNDARIPIVRPRRPLILKWLAVMAFATAVVPITVAAGSGHDDRDDDRDRQTYAIGLWGDLPYSDLQATVGVPNLIADMNQQDLEFTVHDGDLKVGSGSARIHDADDVQRCHVSAGARLLQDAEGASHVHAGRQ